jgi:hypothetical protein
MKTQEQRVSFGDLRQRTFDIYEQGLRLHVLPELGSRQVKSITPDHLVAWHRRRQSEGYTADSIHARWTPLRLVLAHSARVVEHELVHQPRAAAEFRSDQQREAPLA